MTILRIAFRKFPILFLLALGALPNCDILDLGDAIAAEIAVEADSQEPDNSFEAASTISVDNPQQRSLHKKNDVDYMRLTITEPGFYYIGVDRLLGSSINFELYIESNSGEPELLAIEENHTRLFKLDTGQYYLVTSLEDDHAPKAYTIRVNSHLASYILSVHPSGNSAAVLPVISLDDLDLECDVEEPPNSLTVGGYDWPQRIACDKSQFSAGASYTLYTQLFFAPAGVPTVGGYSLSIIDTTAESEFCPGSSLDNGDGTSDDSWEPNDSADQATPISIGCDNSLAANLTDSEDYDFYNFDVP